MTDSLKTGGAALSQRQTSALLVAGCVVFGMGSLIVKFVPVGGFAIAFWRLLIAGGIFWLLMRRFGQKLPKNRTALGFSLLSGVFLGFDLSFWHESIYAVGPGISTLLNSLQIFFLAAAAYWFFSERLSGLQLAGFSVAVLGVVLIAAPEFSHNTRGAYGITAGVVSGAMLAGSMICVRFANCYERVGLFPLMFLVSVGGVAAVLLPAVWLNHGNFFPTTWRDAGLIVVYGVIMQCVAWGMIAYCVPLLPLTLTGLLLLTEPAAALVIDRFLLGRAVSTVQWAGVLLTFAAVYCGSLKPSQRRLSVSKKTGIG